VWASQTSGASGLVELLMVDLRLVDLAVEIRMILAL